LLHHQGSNRASLLPFHSLFSKSTALGAAINAAEPELIDWQVLCETVSALNDGDICYKARGPASALRRAASEIFPVVEHHIAMLTKM